MENISLKYLTLSLLVFITLIIVLLFVMPESYAVGYDVATIAGATWLSLQLLGSALVWTFCIHTCAICLCFISVRWQKEIGQILDMIFQLLSSIPLFILCLYWQSYFVQANLFWAGLILATGDFLLATLFPMLRWNLLRYFRSAYREALQGRGIYFPIFGKTFSWEHWVLFFRYYVIPYLSEFLRVIQSKIPLFFSALIIVEKALFYGTNIEGANRGLGSLFFDCILEWSEGKPRIWILLALGLWCLTLVTLIQLGIVWIHHKIFPNIFANKSEPV